MSQIGFMMFALGVSGFSGEAGIGYTSSMFHLFTHVLFKALLFLYAGSVIHYVHSNEIKDMGGLRKQSPDCNEEKAGETSPLPEIFTIGVTDVTFSPVHTIYDRQLRTPDGHVAIPAYWQQKESISHDEVPYYQVNR